MSKPITKAEAKELHEYIMATQRNLGGGMILYMRDTNADTMKLKMELTNKKISMDKYEIKTVVSKVKNKKVSQSNTQSAKTLSGIEKISILGKYE